MRRFALLVCVVATAAVAVSGVAFAETPLGVSPNYGTVLANDGGSATNQYNSPPYNTFVIGGPQLLTVFCDQDSLIGVSRTTCSKSTCIPIPAGIPVTTSCNANSFILRDGGGYSGCMVVNAPNVTDGGVVSTCYWMRRQGNEGP
jgi:hypothetical protein